MQRTIRCLKMWHKTKTGTGYAKQIQQDDMLVKKMTHYATQGSHTSVSNKKLTATRYDAK